MAAELFVVPEPDFGDGDGGDGGDSSLDDLVYLAERILRASLAKFDWVAHVSTLLETAKQVTDDEADASTLIYLMRRADIDFTVTIEGVEDLG